MVFLFLARFNYSNHQPRRPSLPLTEAEAEPEEHRPRGGGDVIGTQSDADKVLCGLHLQNIGDSGGGGGGDRKVGGKLGRPNRKSCPVVGLLVDVGDQLLGRVPPKLRAE